MKHIIKSVFTATILFAFILGVGWLTTGCATSEPSKNCDTYSAVYEAYLASTQIGRPISSEEAMGAAAAAVFLRTYCGWTPPPVTRSGGGTVDANGVPILIPPQ